MLTTRDNTPFLKKKQSFSEENLICELSCDFGFSTQGALFFELGNLDFSQKTSWRYKAAFQGSWRGLGGCDFVNWTGRGKFSKRGRVCGDGDSTSSYLGKGKRVEFDNLFEGRLVLSFLGGDAARMLL